MFVDASALVAILLEKPVPPPTTLILSLSKDVG